MVKKKRGGPMKYEYAPDLQERMVEIVQMLEMDHIKLDRVECLRSFGSSTRRTIARCHTIGKLMQKAMKTKGFYAIEFLEPFDRMSKVEQDKTIIHELMHIPKTFGGGFRQHDHVCDKNVDLMYEKLKILEKSSTRSTQGVEGYVQMKMPKEIVENVPEKSWKTKVSTLFDF